MKTLIKALGVLVVIMGGMFVYSQKSSGFVAQAIDKMNPIVIEGEVYVKTTEPESVDEHGAGQYKQEAADKDGHTRQVEFMGMGKLKTNRYLKLKNKGAYVMGYEEVAKSEVPAKALAIID